MHYGKHKKGLGEKWRVACLGTLINPSEEGDSRNIAGGGRGEGANQGKLSNADQQAQQVSSFSPTRGGKGGKKGGCRCPKRVKVLERARRTVVQTQLFSLGHRSLPES